MRNGGNAAGKVRGCRKPCAVSLGGLRRRITGVGGGKVSKIAAHCALSQGCKTALVALVTPWMRTARTAVKQSQHFRRTIADVSLRLADGLPTGLPTGALIGLGLVRPRLILIQPARPSSRPTYRRLRLAFFRLGVRIHHRRCPALALAHRLAGLAPTARL